MSIQSAKTWIFNNLLDFVKAEGTLVEKEIAEKRIEICKGCEFYGKVEPLPQIILDGCTLCGCPTATKAHMKTILRKKNNLGDNLTIGEILELKTLKKFKKDDFVEEEIICTYPQKNKWDFNL